MIQKTFEYRIELPVNGSNRTVKTEWTIDLQGDKVIDLEIVSCDADLDERQYDKLKEICMAMRHMTPTKMVYIDESVIDLTKVDNIELQDINDYPDFADASILSADYNGIPMSDEQLTVLNDNSQFIYESVIEYIS